MSELEEKKDQGIDFNSLNLQVGIRLQLEVVRDVKPIQVISSLIGYSSGEYLILRTPDPRHESVAFRLGEKLTVRVFSGVKVCAFDVTVERLFDNPLFYMHVSFPQHIRGTHLRSAMRVKTALPSKLKAVAGDLPVTLLNLSVKGALVESAQQCGQVGERVKLSFALPTSSKQVSDQIEVDAVIRNVSIVMKQGQAESVFRCGVEFDSLRHLDQLMLQNFTYETVLTQRHNIV